MSAANARGGRMIVTSRNIKTKGIVTPIKIVRIKEGYHAP